MNKIIEDSEAAATVKQQELTQANSDKMSRVDSMATAQSDLKAARKKKATSQEAREDLEASCAPGESYEDRAGRRQEEIDALKNALQVLEGEAIPVLSGSSLTQVQTVSATPESVMEQAASAMGVTVT